MSMPLVRSAEIASRKHRHCCNTAKIKRMCYFARQPATPEEEIAAGRAMDVCPTLAIGDDGEL